MCCTAMPSRLSNTTLLNAMVDHPKLGRIRVLGYEAKYQNIPTDGVSSNMLFWPLGKHHITRNNFIETKDGGGDVMQTMARALAPRTRGVRLDGVYGASKGEIAEVFEYNDNATVVLSPSAEAIMEAVEGLSGKQKPNYIPTRLIPWMGKAYPGEMLAVVVFWNNQPKRLPVMLWEPVGDDQEFRFYSMDFHGDGRHDVPDPNETVSVDHTLVVAYPYMPSGVRPGYSLEVPQAIMDFMPPKITGKIVSGRMTNGDFAIGIADIAKGADYFRRVNPPGIQ